VVLTVAIAFGWIAVGELLGQGLARWLNMTHLSPAVAAGIGTALLSLAVAVTSWVPCIGWVGPGVVSSVGVGGGGLTGFGALPYLPSSGPALPAVSAQT